MKFFREIFARIKNVRIFAAVIEKHTTRSYKKLFYGVMVTRQILVLKFQVRALVEQRKKV